MKCDNCSTDLNRHSFCSSLCRVQYHRRNSKPTTIGYDTANVKVDLTNAVTISNKVTKRNKNVTKRNVNKVIGELHKETEELQDIPTTYTPTNIPLKKVGKKEAKDPFGMCSKHTGSFYVCKKFCFFYDCLGSILFWNNGLVIGILSLNKA